MLSPTVGFPTVRLDRQFLSPIDHRYYYQSFIRLSYYFPSYVAPANQVLIFGRTSRSGSSQSWVYSGFYLAPKNIIQRLKQLLYKDYMNTNLTVYNMRSEKGRFVCIFPWDKMPARHSLHRQVERLLTEDS